MSEKDKLATIENLEFAPLSDEAMARIARGSCILNSCSSHDCSNPPPQSTARVEQAADD